METDSLPRPNGETPRPVTPPPAEWRALSRLRERVEEAAREIERLRSSNAALAQRVLELQAGLGDDAPAISLPDMGDPEALRARVQGFIDTIDEVLAAPVAEGATDEAADDEDA